MPRHLSLVPAVLVVLLLAGCGGGATPSAPATVTVTVPVPVPATGAAAPQVAKSWVMPSLVGTGLQAAQDSMQALTGNPVFVTSSHDATGVGRMQVSDRNWKVCDQNVAPGTRITAETKIDFGAVKLEERC